MIKTAYAFAINPLNPEEFCKIYLLDLVLLCCVTCSSKLYIIFVIALQNVIKF